MPALMWLMPDACAAQTAISSVSSNILPVQRYGWIEQMEGHNTKPPLLGRALLTKDERDLETI
jgi:hypothetical protein